MISITTYFLVVAPLLIVAGCFLLVLIITLIEWFFNE